MLPPIIWRWRSWRFHWQRCWWCTAWHGPEHEERLAVREMEMPQPVSPATYVSASADPWLAFAVHHGVRAHRPEAPKEGGLTLAAEATLRGPFAVLVGPSGAGKTSLLRSI